jgi:hypothetical protein
MSYNPLPSLWNNYILAATFWTFTTLHQQLMQSNIIECIYKNNAF